MPKKKSGFPYEVHPTPMKGKDGRNIVYARPARGLKLDIEKIDSYCHQHYKTADGELEYVFKQFVKCASELMARGYRIDTPIGSFAPRLRVIREITDPDDVQGRDVRFDGVEYNSGKLWHESVEKWLEGFRRVQNTNAQEVLADQEKLEAILHECLERYHGYVTVRLFSIHTGLTYYSAKKQLNQWTLGQQAKLLKTKRRQEYIYTEI